MISAHLPPTGQAEFVRNWVGPVLFLEPADAPKAATLTAADRRRLREATIAHRRRLGITPLLTVGPESLGTILRKAGRLCSTPRCVAIEGQQ